MLYQGQRLELYADTLFAAKTKAIESLRVPRKKEHLVYVMLAEKNGKDVVHTADF